MNQTTLATDKIPVYVKPLLMALVPGYLHRRQAEVTLLSELLKSEDFEAIQSIGHKLSGNASTYGFHDLSAIGKELEATAQSKDSIKIQTLIQKFGNYLSQIEIIAGGGPGQTG